MTARTREGWPDVAKGMCIILVVLWHAVTKHMQEIEWADAGAIPEGWTLVTAQLLPLRMPLFFLVSGMLAARAVFAVERRSIGRRMATLAALYGLWLGIQTVVLALTPDFDTARAQTVGQLFAELTIDPTNLWYLIALAVYLLVGRLTRRVPATIVLGVALVLSAIAATGILADEGNRWQILQNLVFFLAGLRLRPALTRVAAQVSPLRLLVVAGVFAAGLATVGLLGARQWFGVWPLLSAVAVLAGVLGCALLDRRAPRLAAPLRWLGRRTLPIYVVHMMPLALLDGLLRTGGTPWARGPVAALLDPLVLTAVVIAICLGVQALLRRIGLGFLLDPLQEPYRRGEQPEPPPEGGGGPGDRGVVAASAQSKAASG